MNQRTLQLAGHTWNFGSRFDLKRDYLNVLDALRDAGCTQFEAFLDQTALYQGHLEGRGLQVLAGHAVTSLLRDTESVLTMMQAAGVRDLNVSGPLEWHARTPDDWRAAAEVLNTAGPKLRSAGCWLHYHNHEFEFHSQNGEPCGMDVLAEELDFNTVDWCFDVGWAQVGGTDPLRWMQEHGERIGWVHLRDFAGENSVALGEGEIELEPIIALLDNLPQLRGVAFEQDRPADPTASLRTSLEFWRAVRASPREEN